MTVTDFAPVGGTLGGALIGLAAAVLLLCNGDIFGCSGITSSVFLHPQKTAKEQSWKLVFLATFFVTSSIYPASVTQDTRLYQDPSIPIPSIAAYVLGGFLVAFGTTLGSGCTTGHGVCGMARFSLRSFVSVATFLGTAMGTAVLTSPTTNLIKAFHTSSAIFEPIEIPWVGWLLTALMTLGTLVAVMRKPRGEEEPLEGAETGMAPIGGEREQQIHVRATVAAAKLVPAGVSGALFSGGLAWSGMDLQSKNFAFLNLSLIPTGQWDPTLLTVMGAAVVVSFVSYQFVPEFSKFRHIKNLECPLMVKDGTFNVPNRTKVDLPLVGGAVCFGIGWGISGLCPGPGLLQMASGNQAVVYLYCPCYALGIFVADRVKLWWLDRPSNASAPLEEGDNTQTAAEK